MAENLNPPAQPAAAMGHGVKQRNIIQMTQSEIDDFLSGRRSMAMSTINPDGSIHTVAMWYGFLEGCVAIESKAKAQKVLNLRRNPNITMMVEDGEKYEELRGVTIIGTAEIIDDPERMFTLGISVFERYMGVQYTDAMKSAVNAMLHKRVVVKVNPTKVVSWDHHKLGLGR
jgi:PPOX class probable F420-dependent enzyme